MLELDVYHRLARSTGKGSGVANSPLLLLLSAGTRHQTRRPQTEQEHEQERQQVWPDWSPLTSDV